MKRILILSLFLFCCTMASAQYMPDVKVRWGRLVIDGHRVNKSETGLYFSEDSGRAYVRATRAHDFGAGLVITGGTIAALGGGLYLYSHPPGYEAKTEDMGGVLLLGISAGGLVYSGIGLLVLLDGYHMLKKIGRQYSAIQSPALSFGPTTSGYGLRLCF